MNVTLVKVMKVIKLEDLETDLDLYYILSSTSSYFIEEGSFVLVKPKDLFFTLNSNLEKRNQSVVNNHQLESLKNILTQLVTISENPQIWIALDTNQFNYDADFTKDISESQAIKEVLGM